MRQLDDSEAEVQRLREELREAVINERIDALRCSGCAENIRCSQCYDCIACCDAGGKCKLSGVESHERILPGFHITYAKPPLPLPSPESDTD